MSPQPTVSSYAILGLLALRSWTGYDLTRQATRSLRFAWPKSERLLYSEPKKLVELGWATTYQETVDGRSRNVYEITYDGCDALEAWMTTRPGPPQLEAEALLRVLFAEHGNRDDAKASLETLRGDAREMEDRVVTINASYLEGGHPFPDRTHLSVLFATFQVEMFRLVQRWVDFASDEIDTWPDIKGVGRTDRVDELIVAIRDRCSLLADEPPHERAAPTSP
ncbi:MAG: PadR family transcriptional regulator [Ilumatobacter sp.]